MFMPSGVAAAAAVAFEFDLTAGEFGGFTGFNRSAPAGSLNPDELFKGFQIELLFTAGAGNFTFAFNQINVPQGIFGRLTMDGTFVSGVAQLVMVQSLATYVADDGNGRTTWTITSTPETIVDTNVYAVVIT